MWSVIELHVFTYSCYTVTGMPLSLVLSLIEEYKIKRSCEPDLMGVVYQVQAIIYCSHSIYVLNVKCSASIYGLKDRNATQISQIWVVSGHSRLSVTSVFDTSHTVPFSISLYAGLNKFVPVLHVVRDSARYWSKVTHCFLYPGVVGPVGRGPIMSETYSPWTTKRHRLIDDAFPLRSTE